MEFALFISFFIAQRISELLVAKKNEKWLRANGAVEYGQKHYPYIVTLHALFIAALIVEFIFRPDSKFDPSFLSLYILLVLAKILVIASLGRYWNTKILRIPNIAPVRKGLYKYFRHPNYFIVVCEFIIVPFVFHLFYTAFIFTILNGIILSIRIREEDRVWNFEKN
jgi:methyltransferase